MATKRAADCRLYRGAVLLVMWTTWCITGGCLRKPQPISPKKRPAAAPAEPAPVGKKAPAGEAVRVAPQTESPRVSAPAEPSPSAPAERVGETSATAAGDLVRNGDFSGKTETGLPADWTVVGSQRVSVVGVQEAPHGTGQALRVDIVKDGGKSYGQIFQNIRAKPDTIYRLAGKTRSSEQNLAFFSVKLRRDGREIKRISLEKSRTEWAGSTHEFGSGDADEIQVLCRWNQTREGGCVGQTAWFADVKLVERGPAPSPPAWKQALKRAIAIEPVSPPTLPLGPSPADIYLTPSGAGRRDGTSWTNALPGNAPGVLQAAWDALAPGRACRLGSGIYVNASLTVSSGGTGPDERKSLAGEDTGGGLPWLVGNWKPEALSKGMTFVTLTNEVDHCAFENLRLVRYRRGIYSRRGRHVGLRIRDLDVYESRFGIYLYGLANADEAQLASHDVRIQDCDFVHFTKSAIRLEGGNHDFQLVNCVADAGGKAWMKESFQVCYNVRGDYNRRKRKPKDKPWAEEHDIIFINCVARNCIWSKNRYWQGDGFCIESGCHHLAFINCIASDCADGGWDNKARFNVFVNCVGLRCKMNYRIWNHAFMHNCLSAYSYKHGGSWSSKGVWTTGSLRASFCTFHNNNGRQIVADSKVDSRTRKVIREADVRLERCIVSFDGASSDTAGLYGGESRIKKTGTAEWDGKAGKGVDPAYVAAMDNRSWDGEPADVFDSRTHGAAKGFRSGLLSSWRARDPDELVEIARSLLKSKDWKGFTRTISKLDHRVTGTK